LCFQQVAIPFKWGQVSYFICSLLGTKEGIVAIPFKWGQVFQQFHQPCGMDRDFKRVAIPFKWGQVFQPPRGSHFNLWGAESQSLLNEVKYSNGIDRITCRSHVQVAIPFKWGQVFQRVAWKLAELIKSLVAIPFKWGQVFQHYRRLDDPYDYH